MFYDAQAKEQTESRGRAVIKLQPGPRRFTLLLIQYGASINKKAIHFVDKAISCCLGESNPNYKQKQEKRRQSKSGLFFLSFRKGNLVKAVIY